MGIQGIQPRVLAKRLADNVTQQAFDAVITPLNQLLTWVQQNLTQTGPTGALTIVPTVNVGTLAANTQIQAPNLQVLAYQTYVAPAASQTNTIITTVTAYAPVATSVAAITLVPLGGSVTSGTFSFALLSGSGANVTNTSITSGQNQKVTLYPRGAAPIPQGLFYGIYSTPAGYTQSATNMDISVLLWQ